MKWTIPGKILSKLTKEKTENLSRSVTSKEIELVIFKLPINIIPDTDGFNGELYQTFKDLEPILHKLF